MNSVVLTCSGMCRDADGMADSVDLDLMTDIVDLDQTAPLTLFTQTCLSEN